MHRNNIVWTCFLVAKRKEKRNQVLKCFKSRMCVVCVEGERARSTLSYLQPGNVIRTRPASITGMKRG